MPLELKLGSTRVSVAPDALGASPVIDKAIEKALASPPDTAVLLNVNAPGGNVVAFVRDLAQRYNRAAVDSQALASELPSVPLAVDRPGRTLQQKRAVRDIVSELYSGDRTPIQLYQINQRAKVTRRNFGPVIVIRRGANQLDPLQRDAPHARVQGRDRPDASTRPRSAVQIVVKWKNPWWYPPDSPWAAGEKPVPPGPGNPLGTRWMGFSAPGVGIHGTPTTARSATRSRTAASGCTSRRPSGCSTTSTSGRRSSSSPRRWPARRAHGAGARRRGSSSGCSRCSSGRSRTTATRASRQAARGRRQADARRTSTLARLDGDGQLDRSLAARQGRRARLLGVVVRSVQAGGAALEAACSATATGRRRSSASTRRTSPATRALRARARHHLPARARRHRPTGAATA